MKEIIIKTQEELDQIKKVEKVIIENELMTIKEVAKNLRVSQSTVYRLIWQNKLPAYRVGGWRIKVAELEEWKNKQRNQI